MAKIQSCGILDSFDKKSNDECEQEHMKRGKDMLELIHNDVYESL